MPLVTVQFTILLSLLYLCHNAVLLFRAVLYRRMAIILIELVSRGIKLGLFQR